MVVGFTRCRRDGGGLTATALLLVWLGWVLLPANAARAQQAASPARVRFTFWNVQWFPGRQPDAGEVARARHVAAVAPVVRRLNPDVLGLEEVADADAVRRLTDGLPGDYRVDVVTDFRRETTQRGEGEPTRQQIALASRLPLVRAGWEPWRPGAGGVQPRRGFALAVYRPAPGQVLVVYGLHLKSNRFDEPGGAAANERMRAESVRQLLAHARATAAACAPLGAVTVVFGGDFNTSLDDPRFDAEDSLRALLRDRYRWAWQHVPPAARITLPGSGHYPDATFDHVFFRPSAAAASARLLGAGVEPTGYECSDHRPVTVTLGLGGKG